MTDNFNDYLPSGEPSPDRWATALHIFDAGAGVPHEETPAETWERANALFDAKAYTKAAALLAPLVDEVPEQCAVRMLLARAYFHSAQLRRAEDQLREVIRRDPVEPYAHLMLGRTLQRLNRAEEAETWMRMAAAFSGDLTAAV